MKGGPLLTNPPPVPEIPCVHISRNPCGRCAPNPASDAGALIDDMSPRMKRFLASPPRRISEKAVKARKAKASRTYPGPWLEECCEAQGWRCFYCGTLLRKKPHKTEQHLRATIDHVVPLSAGGKNCRSNVVAACIRCNQEKGSMAAEEYKAIWAERHERRRHWANPPSSHRPPGGDW